jgi:tetratricopeptide (TPR) repeat protein
MRIGMRMLWAGLLMAGLGAPLHAEDGPSDRLVAASRLQDAGNHREAIALLEQIREVDPRNPQVLYGLALSLYAVADYREAAHVGETLLAEQKGAAGDLYVIVGSAYGRLNEWAKSEAVFRNGLTAWPDLPALRIQHAISLEGLGRLDEAVAELQNCVARSPYEAGLWRALGDALSATGAPGRAFAAYVRSLTLESDDARSKEVAAELWHVLFQGAAGASTSDASEKAEAKGLALVAALRHDKLWSGTSDAGFFAYALDTSLRLVSALHGQESAGMFWRPFVLDYFDEVRAAGHMEALAYTVRQATGDPDVARWCAQNHKKVEAFKSWSERWAVHRSEVAQRPGDSFGR